MQTFDQYQNRWPWVTLNSQVAVTKHYFTQYGSFRSQLRKICWRLDPYCQRQKWSLRSLIIGYGLWLATRPISAVAELLVKIYVTMTQSEPREPKNSEETFSFNSEMPNKSWIKCIARCVVGIIITFTSFTHALRALVTTLFFANFLPW